MKSKFETNKLLLTNFKQTKQFTKRKAMKNILDNDLSSEESLETIEEINILRRLNSPYIIQYIDCFKEFFMISIITEVRSSVLF